MVSTCDLWCSSVSRLQSSNIYIYIYVYIYEYIYISRTFSRGYLKVCLFRVLVNYLLMKVSLIFTSVILERDN